ncbi:MAG TPA: HemK2/MTQ2 family protein methyltransferase [Solirubrobacteraceae bacterium]
MRIFTLPGVFKPRSDSRLLARVLCEQLPADGARVLDLCTGSGIVGVSAARHRRADVTVVDVSRRAVLTARLNARLNGTRVQGRRGDLLAAVAGERFDAIVSNPPYLPSETDDLPGRGPERAWEGGRDGRALLDRIVAAAPAHLRPGGLVLLVFSEVCGTQHVLDGLRAGGLDAEVVVRDRGPLGPLLGERAARLVEQGLLAPGQTEEDVVVVRAVAPRTAPQRSPQLATTEV